MDNVKKSWDIIYDGLIVNGDTLMLMIMLTITLVLFLFVFIHILLYGISHMKILKAMGFKYAWLAWVPVFNRYALLSCLPIDKTFPVLGGSGYKYRIAVYTIPVIVMIYFFLPFGIFPILLYNCIIRGYCYRLIYAEIWDKDCDSTAFIGHLSGVFTIIPTFIFLFKNIKKLKLDNVGNKVVRILS